MAKMEFLGRGAVYSHHLGVPYRALKVDAKKSLPAKKGKPNLNDNLIVHGDNLHALKALLPTYEGKVKCIYIDPPYNTGNEGWIYNDKVNSPLMKDWFGKVVDSDDQCRHDKWLCMMWPRLHLLRDLLADNGVIFVSINDHEVHHLRVIMDEIFGEENFVQTFTWVKREKTSGVPTQRMILPNFEYVLCYKKYEDIRFLGQAKSLKSYKKDKSGRYWRSMPIQATGKQNNHFSIVNPETGKSYYGNWALAEDTIKDMIEEEKILFPKSDNGKPSQVVYADEKNASPIFAHLGKFDSELSTKALIKLFDGKKVFDFPKPFDLLLQIVAQITDKDDLILDSFAGSGTTAHAVLALNKEDGGNRKFILVECEDYADTVTAERVRRVINGLPKTKGTTMKVGLDGSFTYATLGDPIDAEMMLTGKSLPPYDQLARHIFWTATGKTFEGQAKERKDGFIGQTAKYRVYLIYRPDLTFLGSDDAALTLEKVKALRKATSSKKRLLIFAPVSYMSQEDLSKYRVIFCQLPWAINQRVE